MALRLRSWFFTSTATSTKRGSRFKNGDRPTESTFKDFSDSVLHKSEISDRAKEEDSQISLAETNGHVVAANDGQAKAYLDKVIDRTYSVQPNQLPEVIDNGSSNYNFNDNTYLNNYSGKDIEVILDSSSPNQAKRNVFTVRFLSAFRTWLVDQFKALQSNLKSVTQTVSTHNTEIASIKVTLATVSGGIIDITEISPIGSVQSYVGAADPNAKWFIMDGRSLLQASYPSLYALIGTTYGAGDSPGTTFNIPNMTGKGVKGVSGSYPLGSNGGSDTLTLAADQIPPHSHPLDSATVTIGSGGAHGHTWTNGNPSWFNGGGDLNNSTGNGAKLDFQRSTDIDNTSGSHSHTATISGNTGLQYSGSQQAINMNSPYVALNWIIKVL